MSDERIKLTLFNDWTDDHLAMSPLPLFDPSRQGFFLREASIKFLSTNKDLGMYLYILFVRKSENNSYPIYIGKTSSLLKRWVNGHVKKLQESYINGSNNLYKKWIANLVDCKEKVFLGCIHESKVKYPPIPNFPQTIGAVEYQLISLAQDAYPNKLLNKEGVSR